MLWKTKIYFVLPQVYKGYVDDPRNTDNAWMETVAVNFHDESGISNVCGRCALLC